MKPADLGAESQKQLQEALGYLNLSSGAADARFRQNIDRLSSQLATQADADRAPWQALADLLGQRLRELQGTSAAFATTEQAQRVIRLALDELPAAYRRHHRDLLFYCSDAEIFQPFFLARACEAVLQQGGPWDESERIVGEALGALNDFLGHRPVAVLRTPRKIEPYEHEWVCPIPLYFRGAGVASGRYHDLLERALKIVGSASRGLLDQACFDPANLEEVSLDPRAYDFDHPVNKRPNYHFGQWDPHAIDPRGRYRRFVLVGVTLDALLGRVEGDSRLPREELLDEAASVLAGVMLMASGISGSGPDTHDSSVTLSNLVPRIARYRDAFYEERLAAVEGAHGARLRDEARQLRQPFGGARQDLNVRLARLRARQLEHVGLAQLYARMGYPEASGRQVRVVPVVSARMLCEIDCRIVAGHHAIDRGRLASTAEALAEVEDLLRRAVDCGAVADPWNILGFAGQFSLFPAMENSIRDHRVDVLVRIMQRIFALHSRLRKEAAAAGQEEAFQAAFDGFAALTRWWDQFAASTVEDVDAVSGVEAWESALHVGSALAAWREAGEAAGDISFWRRHVDSFSSARAYALVVETLLDRRDHVAASALLVQWLSQAQHIPLEEEEYSFQELAGRWLRSVLSPAPASGPCTDGLAPSANVESAGQAQVANWPSVRRFFDLLEANSEEYWQVPDFELGRERLSPRADDDERGGDDNEDRDQEDDDEGDDTFGAAYEGVTYRDSTADGVEGETLDGLGQPSDYELDQEAERLSRRLAFLGGVARSWKRACMASGTAGDAGDRAADLATWLERTRSNHGQLKRLLDEIGRHRVPEPSTAHESLVEYDRRRQVKEGLMERVIAACVDVRDAAWHLASALPDGRAADDADGLAPWEVRLVNVLAAMRRVDANQVRESFPELLSSLGSLPLIYRPLSRQGEAERILLVETVQQALRELFRGLPRLGLLKETCQLIAAAQAMERNQPIGGGAVSQFDRLFKTGYQALVETLIELADCWGESNQPRQANQAANRPDSARPGRGPRPESSSDEGLVDCLGRLTESLLIRWLLHSRTLRLSVLERITDDDHWQKVVKFIEKYGHDLFTARFLNLGNLRAILHQGVAAYLTGLEEDDGGEERPSLLDDLDGALDRNEAAETIGLIIEAVVENYGEYKDYNSTTTQSDRGEMLYTFLDFLRLKSAYERIAWNLGPVVMAHEILARRGKLDAAELWRRALLEKTRDAAEKLVRSLDKLTKKYAMRLPTIADRLGERFVRPLAVDRLRALIAPAMEEARQGAPPASFQALEEEIEEFTRQPTGSGLDVPAWLAALHEEVAQLADPAHAEEPPADDRPPIPQTPLTIEEVQAQIEKWE